MIIKTSVNLDRITRSTLQGAAQKTGLSVSTIIVQLVNEYRTHMDISPVYGQPVQYQERDNNAGWKGEHIAIDEAQYEMFNDLRRICKLSVSLIVSFSIAHFLEKLFGQHEKNALDSDNNHIISYSIDKHEHHNLIIWEINWGLSPHT